VEKTTRVKIGARGTVTLPKELRADLPKGGELEVVRRPDGVIELRPPTEHDPDQVWFWTERWQQMGAPGRRGHRRWPDHHVRERRGFS